MTASATQIAKATDVSVQIQLSAPSIGSLCLGTVTATGSLVTGLAVNDRVALHVPTATGQSCGHCFWCLKGKGNLCSKHTASTVAQDLIPGQEAVVPAKSVFKVTNAVSSVDALEAAASVYSPLRKHMVLGARVGIVTMTDSPMPGTQQKMALSIAQALGAGQVTTESMGANSLDLLLVLLGSVSVPRHVPWEELIGRVDAGGKVVIVGAQAQVSGHNEGLGIHLNLGALISGQREVVGSTWEVPRGEVEEMVRFAEKMEVELAV